MVTKKPFGTTGVDVAVVGQGSWNLPESGAARSEAKHALLRGIELGMTHIDTAEMYGNGEVESELGEFLAGVPRDALFLTSKVLPSNASYDGTIAACERTLGRMRVDHLDLYLLHWAGEHPLEETMRALETLANQGKTRFIGVSNFDLDELREAQSFLRVHRIASNQVLYNLTERGIEHLLAVRRARHRGGRLSPFARGKTRRADDVLTRIAEARCARHQVMLAFLAHAAAVRDPQGRLARPRREQLSRGQLHLDADDLAVDAAFRSAMTDPRHAHDASSLRAVIEVALEAGAARSDHRHVRRRRDPRRMAASFARRSGDAGSSATGKCGAKAADPRAVLASARSVVCIAVRPYACGAASDRRALRGRVSNYAWSPTIIHASARCRPSPCDRRDGRRERHRDRVRHRAAGGPRGERRARWIGKHTNLISPELGSFVFLERSSSLDLAPDVPLRKTCAVRAACVSACPTALRGDADRRDPVHLGSDPAHRRHSRARCAARRHADLGMRPLRIACPPTRLARPAVAAINARVPQRQLSPRW